LLKKRGVEFKERRTVTHIECKGQVITGVTVKHDGKVEPVDKDYYVSAIPVEDLVPLITPAMTKADPGLAKLERLTTRWMTGAMYYLKRDVPLQRGHTIFIDSDWSLTAISQAQFWQHVDLDGYGNGKADGILSVDISTPTPRSPRGVGIQLFMVHAFAAGLYTSSMLVCASGSPPPRSNTSWSTAGPTSSTPIPPCATS